MTPHERQAIGPLPRGHGLLGLIIREARSYRIPDIAAHPDSSGFPPNHPPMTSFLGVPITSRGRSVGNFYLTDKVGAAEFTRGRPAAGRDVRAPRRHRDRERPAAPGGRRPRRRRGARADRPRPARRDHPVALRGVAVARGRAGAHGSSPGRGRGPGRRRDRLAPGLDPRHPQLHLRPAARDLRRRRRRRPGIVALGEQFRYNTLVEIDVDVDAEAGARPLAGARGRAPPARPRGPEQRRPPRAGPAPRPSPSDGEADGPTLVIADDGDGFDASAPRRRRPPRPRATCAARAEAIGATLRVESASGQGTRIIVALPGRADA